MKRVLFVAAALALAGGGQALAADLPPAAAPPPPPAAYAPPAVYNWTGLYIGGNLGAAWTGGNFSDPAGNAFTATSTTQFVGGGQVGANYQFWSGAVIGVEGDFEWLSNASNTSNSVTVGKNTASLTANNRWLTTVTGRFGYAFDRLLVYGKGGGAWVGSSTPTITVNGVPFSTTVNSNWGWTAGFGLEWYFAARWSLRAEYDYVGLQSQSFVVPAAAPGIFSGDTFTGNNRHIHLATAGINYKFAPW
jgi:outer membrane immunogenic protein